MVTKSLLLPLFLCFFFLFGSLVLAQSDPRLEECMQNCSQKPEQQQERQQCEKHCKERYRKDREQVRRPTQELQQCKQRGRQAAQQQQERQLYEQYCESIFEGDQKSWEQVDGREEKQGEDGGTDNPYYFSRERYIGRIRLKEGQAKLMERFSARSELLRRVENYRVAIHEYNTNTFLLPGLRDAEGVYFVVRGEGSITYLQHDGRESHDIQRGDIIRVRSGITTYIHTIEKLHIVQFLQPIFTPGLFTVFFPASSTKLDSFYSVFSNEILEAAFKTPRAKLERLIGQKSRGFFLPASPELQWLPPSPGKDRNQPYHLFNEKPPIYSNNYGQLYEANPSEFPQLTDLDVHVSFANISKGAMFAPHYNSRSTEIAVVVKGNGYYEMASPNLSPRRRKREQGEGSQYTEEKDGDLEEKQQQSGSTYQKVSARLSPDDVFIVPPAHPLVIVASPDENLQIIRFEINAQGNEKFLLAGENNMIQHLERVAKELSFGVPAREVDEVFDAQRDGVFLPGPNNTKKSVT